MGNPDNHKKWNQPHEAHNPPNLASDDVADADEDDDYDYNDNDGDDVDYYSDYYQY